MSDAPGPGAGESKQGRPTVADFYGRQVANPAHGEHWAGPAEMVDAIAALLGTRSEYHVLDVGCGVGGPARRLVAATECRVVGVDVLPHVLLAAKGDPAVGPKFAAGDGCALPFRARTFDQVWSLGVVAHLTSLSAFAEEAVRVLRGGGAAVMTEAFWDGRRAARFALTAPDPWRPLGLSVLVAALRSAGFQRVQVREWQAEVPDSTGDAGLDADLRDGRLAPAMVVAWNAL